MRRLGFVMAILVTVGGVTSAFGKAFPVTIDKIVDTHLNAGAAGVHRLSVHVTTEVPIEPRLLRTSFNGKEVLMTVSRYTSESEPYVYYQLESNIVDIWLDTQNKMEVAAGVTSVEAFQKQLPLKVLLEAGAVDYQPAVVTQVLDDQAGERGVRRLTLKIDHPILNAGKTAKVTLNGVSIFLKGDTFTGAQGEYQLTTDTIVLELNPLDPMLAKTGVASGEDLKKLLPLPIQIAE